MLRLSCEEQALPFLRTPASSGKRRESQPTENSGHPKQEKGPSKEIAVAPKQTTLANRL